MKDIIRPAKSSNKTIKKQFRIYGRDKEKVWKIIWATQGKNKDIQYSAHTTDGKIYTSVHQSGEVHTTTHLLDKQQYEMQVKKNWTLDNFKYFDKLNFGGITKEALISIPLTKEKAQGKEIVYIDLAEYSKELNYWFFLVEKRLINKTITQMEEQFPGIRFIFPQLFDPTLLVAVFDPSKVDFGKRLNIKAKENSIQMVLPPEFSLQFSVD